MLLLFLLCAAQFMLILDVAIVYVALPSIERELGIGATDLQWVGTAYTLTFGGLLVLAGRVGDLFGMRRVFLGGLALFTLASALCAAAQDGPQLFVARAVQGAGAAAVSASALALLIAGHAEGPSRARALGVWSAVASAGAVAGQLVGGLVTDLLDWRWIFLLNVPVGVAVLALGARTVPAGGVAAGAPADGTGAPVDAAAGGGSMAAQARRRLDLLGAALLTSGLALLTFALTRVEDGRLSALGLGLAVAALVLLGQFALVERRRPQPLVRLGLLRNRALAAGNAYGALAAGATSGAIFFATLHLQLVRDLSPLEVGAAFAPVTIVILLVAPRGAALVQRVGVRALLLAGTALAAAGAGTLAFLPVDGGLGAVLPGLLLIGLGNGLSIAPTMVAATSGVAAEEQGLASGLISTAQQLGSAIGLAAVSAVAAAVAGAHAAGGVEAEVAGYRAGYVAIVALLALTALAALRAPSARLSAASAAGRGTRGAS